MTRGRAATPDPFDLSAVGRSDELFDALSSRRSREFDDDPAAQLLAALAADVDAGAPPLPPRVTCTSPGSRRRSVAVVLTFGVAVTMLTSAGAAVAVGGESGAHRADRARPAISERSNMNAQRESVAGSDLDDEARDRARESRDLTLPVSRSRSTVPNHETPPPPPNDPTCPPVPPGDHHRPPTAGHHPPNDPHPPNCPHSGGRDDAHGEDHAGNDCHSPAGHHPGENTHKSRNDAHTDHCEDPRTGSR